LDAAQIHHKRAHDFLSDANRAMAPEDKSRFLASAVENAVAIVEAFLCETSTTEEVRQLAWSTLPRYRLLKRVRVHNFHRNPVPYFPSEQVAKERTMYMQGPITLNPGSSPNSAAVVILTPQGLQCHMSGTGTVDRKGGKGGCSEKELCIIDGELVDEFAGNRIRLENALAEFLDKVPEFLVAVSAL
jgi:hypothetical protein